MSLLLGKFDNLHNIELHDIVNCYQDYFTFKISGDTTLLYLDTKILKYYLKEGLNIKYRKYIFLFLKNYESKNNYRLLDKIKYTHINENKYTDDIDNDDIKNLEIIVNLSIKIIQNKNKFTINDTNIVKLDNNFYANTDLFRFYLSKIKNKVFKFSGILINYNNNIKNKILIILTLNILKNINYKKINKKKLVDNNIQKINLQIDINSNLILAEKNNINSWILLIKKYSPSSKIYTIYSRKDLKKLKNKDINNFDYLIVNISLVSNKVYKEYFNKYNNKNTNLSNSIINSLFDNSFNKNLENEYFFNFYLFNWKNIIYDNIEKIQKIYKYNFISHITSINTKYYIFDKSNFDNTLMNYIIRNNIYINDKNIIKTDDIQINIDNFYNFIKTELLITNNSIKTLELDIVYIKLLLSNDEKSIYNKLFNTNDILINNYEKISKFLLFSYKYNFNCVNVNNLYSISKIYYDKLIKKEETKIKVLDDFFKYKNDSESYSEFISKYFNIDILFEKSMDDIKTLKEEFINNIKLYKIKLQYIINIIENYEKNTYNCTLCMDKIEDSNFCIIICGHYFCKDCIRKYVSEKESNFECPICREKFNFNNIYKLTENLDHESYVSTDLLTNNFCADVSSTIIYKNGTKMNNLINLILDSKDKKIIIVTQYKDSMNEIKKILNDNSVLNYSLFFKNNIMNEKHKNLFNNNKNKCILLCNNEDLLTYNFINLSSIFIIDYVKIENENNNIYKSIKNKFMDYNLIKIHYLFIEDTYEEYIVNSFINI